MDCRRYIRHGAAALVLTAAGLGWNLPLLRGVTTIVYGGAGDNLASIWYFWWQRQALVHGLALDGSGAIALPFGFARAANLYTPTGLSLGFLLTSLWGEIATHNILLLASFPLSGIFAYLLCYYLSRHFVGSLFGGLIYMLCPYHSLQAFHYLTNATMQWLPLFVLLLFVAHRRRKPLWAIGCGVVYAVNFLECLYYGYFAAIAWAAFLVYALVVRRLGKQGAEAFGVPSSQGGEAASCGLIRVLTPHFLAASVALAIIAAFQWKSLLVLSGLVQLPRGVLARAGFVRGPEQFSAGDLIHYLVPGRHNVIFFEGFRSFYEARPELYFNPIEHGLYLGYVALALSIFALFRARGDGGVIRFFVVLFVLAALLSMKLRWEVLGVDLPTLSWLMSKAAPMFRSIHRFYVLMILSLAVLSAFGFRELLAGRSASAAAGAFVVSAALVAVEYLTVPDEEMLREEHTPRPYLELAGFVGGTVADYPLQLEDRAACFYQRRHGHPLLNSTEATPTDAQFALIQTVTNPAKPGTAEALATVGVRWVVINLARYADKFNREPPPPVEIPGMSLMLQADDVRLYRVTAPASPCLLLYGEGFLRSELIERDKKWCVAEGDATLFVVNSTSATQERKLCVEAFSYERGGLLVIGCDSKPVGTLRLSDKPAATSAKMKLAPGASSVRLKALFDEPWLRRPSTRPVVFLRFRLL